ncbi:exodeoxyribonuclease VII large subunit [Candidatus Spongiihabitans sp.]|uniref:exodeoxyribonuclease VII large subunit n=1 Tax=Candidatus Spongiihabitans sp. TaxID=3101308 RepID=UPI003C7B5DA6
MTSATSRFVYTVKQLNSELRDLLETSYRSIWVEGEISGLAAPASGHLYFSLKDQTSLIRCVFFRNRQNRNRATPMASPMEGMGVLLNGQISCYEPRGDLQFIVSYMEQAGEGALRRAFEILKQKLAAEGLFEPQHKSEIPTHPGAIGIITSDNGAALHDILVTLERRFPLANVVLYPALVQGAKAPKSIIAAINLAEKRNEVDTLILARGGGSMEDLQAFNDEGVARKVFGCAIPIVCGVGHEVDFTICDFVADQRAPTPTAAAEFVTPDIRQIKQEFLLRHNRLCENTLKYIQDFQQSVDYFTSGLLHPKQKLAGYLAEHKHLYKQLTFYIHSHIELINNLHDKYLSLIAAHSPDSMIQYLGQQLRANRHALSRSVGIQISNKQQALQQNHGKITLMSPEHTLHRGYAIVQNRKNKVITDPRHTKLGESLRIKVSKGQINVLVDEI